jgi:DNA polymerase-3 subunit epsilon
MTYTVWQKLLPMLYEHHIKSYIALSSWLNTKIKTDKASHFEYNIERLVRLKLPECPGVYHMLAKDGTILYVGKATSLKSRVNSYFRGVKNRDRRKLEMLAQVWDIKTKECETPLEAALIESDDIKTFNPPYNLLLKDDNRRIIFYNDAFNDYSEIRCAIFRNGPHKPYDALMSLIEILKSIQTNSSIVFITEEFSPETVQGAWFLFCEQFKISFTFSCIRHYFSVAYSLLRQFEQIHGLYSFEYWWSQEKKKNLEESLSLEQKLANKLSRAFIRAAETLRKSRHLRRLFNSSFIIHSTQKTLHLSNGEFSSYAAPRVNITNFPFNVSHYDRLSIVLSAKNKQLITLK